MKIHFSVELEKKEQILRESICHLLCFIHKRSCGKVRGDRKVSEYGNFFVFSLSVCNETHGWFPARPSLATRHIVKRTLHPWCWPASHSTKSWGSLVIYIILYSYNTSNILFPLSLSTTRLPIGDKDNKIKHGMGSPDNIYFVFTGRFKKILHKQSHTRTVINTKK